jgi:hypothetical protein
MYPIETLEQVCGDWTLTLVRACDDEGHLKYPITESELKDVFAATIGKEAGLTRRSDYALTVRHLHADKNGIAEVGLYTLQVVLADGSDTDFNVWVVPSGTGEHQGVEFRQHGRKTREEREGAAPTVRLTREQVAAVAYALGHLDHAGGEGHFHASMLTHLRSLVTNSKHIAG